MEYISRYFNMELINEENIINVYSIPVSTFSTSNQNELILTLTEIFNSMLSDLIYNKIPSSINDWSGVKFFIIDDTYRSLEINKSKNEMNIYSSYGEGILTIYNEIISNN